MIVMVTTVELSQEVLKVALRMKVKELTIFMVNIKEKVKIVE